MRHPVAANFLARTIHMTTQGSLARAFDEGRLELRKTGPEDELALTPLRELATEDRAIAEEARALAQARKWPTDIAGQPYGWVRLRGETGRDARPRIIRIFERDLFEIEGALRECEDEDVCSILQSMLEARKGAREALAIAAPQDTLPGAK